MDVQEVTAALRQYFAEEILEGKDEGLDDQTPLLEWGLLNSMEMIRLLDFLRRRFRVEIVAADVSPVHFQTMRGIAALVKQYAEAGRANG